MVKKFSIAPCTKKIMLVLLAAAFLLPMSAQAEIKAGSFELSPFIGYNFFENKQNLKDRPVYGIRLGYNFTDRFGLEAALEYMESRVDNKLEPFTRKGQFTSPIDDVKITAYHLDLLYHFMPESKFNPFLVAGFGATNFNPKINDTDMLSFNAGVGAKYWVAENIALRVDFRDNLVSEVFRHRYHNLSAAAGLVFRFGGSGKPAPVVKEAPKAVEKVVIVVAEEPAPKVVEKEKVIILAFEDIHFAFDDATLNPEAKRILRDSIQTLKDNPKAKVRIAGYTSAAGTKEYNQALSERRAKAVRDYLIAEGIITPERLSTIGYGQTRPAEYEAAPQDIYSKAAKANMRVLFEVVVK